MRFAGERTEVKTAAALQLLISLYRNALSAVPAVRHTLKYAPLSRPSCGGQSPYRGENSGSGRHITESLAPIPELENTLGHKLTFNSR